MHAITFRPYRFLWCLTLVILGYYFLGWGGSLLVIATSIDNAT